jgi:four helix bundle protein
MARVNTFRELVAWEKAMMLTRLIYVATREMPRTEQFGLTLQIRRAAVSIPSNIAEGFGRQSRPDLLRFLRVARGSLNEVATQMELACDLEMLCRNDRVDAAIAETDRVLQALIRSLERKGG